MTPNANAIPPTIASRGVMCVQSFDRLCSLLRDPQCPFLDQISLSVVLDELGRFRVWAGNIGALRDGTASLDYRLREASHIRRQVIRLLEDLNVALREASSIASCERPQGVALSPDPGSDSEFFSEESSMVSDADSISEEKLSETGSQPTTEIQQLFLAVIEAITSLFKLSIAIRNPTPKDRYAKSAAITPYDDKPDIGHVWEKFLHARKTPWLIDRLGKAITRRRQYLRYREKHREKLGKELRPRMKNEDPPKAASQFDIVSWSEQASSKNVQSLPSGTTQSTQTIASTYVAKDPTTAEVLSDKGESVTSYATSVSEDDQNTINVPPPPKESANAMPFECPYCYTIQTINNIHAWKRHVFSDLNPYVCTFEDCGQKLFPTRHKWFDHELQSHRKEWVCFTCQYSCRSVDLLDSHMRSRHSGLFMETQLPALINLCERPVAKISAADCPLCDSWEALLRKRMASIDPESLLQTLVVTPPQFRSHLGRHMEQLALFALPKQHEDELDDTNSNAAAVDKSSGHGSVRKALDMPIITLQTIKKMEKAAPADASPSSRDTALHRAASNGNRELAQALLDEGADIGIINTNGETALHQAARHGHSAVLQLFFEKGADIDMKDLSGSTALHRAADKGHEAMVRQLLERGADIDTSDLSGSTALRRAASKGSESVVQLLLEHDASVDAADLRGSTPLHCAAKKGLEGVVRLLLEVGADVNTKDTSGYTALYQAVSRGHVAAAQLLIDKGADVEVRCLKGQTALQETASKGHDIAVRLLLERGASIDAKGPRSMTALHWATYRRHEAVVRVLLDCGADISLTDDDGWTALHGAASKGYRTIAQLLLQLDTTGREVNMKDNGGLSALHRAASEGHGAVVQLLLASGADPKAETKNGETALQLAVERGQVAVVQLLTQFAPAP